MRQVLGWVTVAILCWAARAVAGVEPPDARLQEAQTAFDEAHTLWAGLRSRAAHWRMDAQSSILWASIR